MIKINLKLFFCFFVLFFCFSFIQQLYSLFHINNFLTKIFCRKKINSLWNSSQIYHFMFPLIFSLFYFNSLRIKCSNVTKIMFDLLFLLNISDSHLHPWFLIDHQSLLPLMHFFHLYAFFINNSLLWYWIDITSSMHLFLKLFFEKCQRFKMILECILVISLLKN